MMLAKQVTSNSTIKHSTCVVTETYTLNNDKDTIEGCMYGYKDKY
jgi:hypothetical protein